MFEIEKELLETHEALLNVRVEEKTVKQAMQKAARAISREINIPGFRKGRAPYSRVLHYVGEAAVLQQATDNLLEEIYPEIIEKAEISPYGPGQLEDVEQTPLSFTIRIPLEPKAILGDYRSLRAEWEDATVTDEEIASVADQIREENVVLEPQERPAQYGDEVHINVSGTVDGNLIVDEDDIEVILSEDTPFIAPGFVEALVGMSVDEESSFTVNFPEDFAEEVFRGQEAQFNVKVTGIYERRLPDFDDALASTVGAFETIDALKQDIYNRLLKAKARQKKEAYREELVAALVEQAEAHYPPAMLEDTLDDMIKDTGTRVQRERQMSLEDALQLDGVTLAQLRENLTPQAEASIKRSLVLSAFAEQERIEVSDDEVVLEFNNLFTSLGQEAAIPDMDLDLDSPFGRNLRFSALGRKALERLELIGRGEAEGDGTPIEAEETTVAEEPDLETDEDSVEEETPVVEEETSAEEMPVVEEETPTEETTVDEVSAEEEVPTAKETSEAAEGEA